MALLTFYSYLFSYYFPPQYSHFKHSYHISKTCLSRRHTHTNIHNLYNLYQHFTIYANKFDCNTVWRLVMNDVGNYTFLTNQAACWGFILNKFQHGVHTPTAAAHRKLLYFTILHTYHQHIEHSSTQPTICNLHFEERINCIYKLLYFINNRQSAAA